MERRVASSEEPDVPKILLVDDDSAIRKLLRESFEDSGFLTGEADGGVEALAQVPTFRPDLVLLDVVMHELDGFETCTRIHQLPGCEDLPVLMMTALDGVEHVNRAFDCGAADVVAKPLNWVSLIRRVQGLIDVARMARRLRQAEASQRILLDLLDVLYFRFLPDGTILDCRAGASFDKAIDLSRREGRIQDFLGPDDPDEFLRLVIAAASPGGQQRFVHRLKIGDEARRYAIRVCSNENNEMSAVVASVSEGAVTDRSGMFAKIAEQLPDPLFVLDGGGRVEYWNKAAAKQLANGGRCAVNGRGLSFVHPDDATALFDGIVNSFASAGRADRVEFRVQTCTGWRVWSGSIANLLREPKVEGFLLLCRDVTEARDHEAQLEEQISLVEARDRVKSEFLAVVAHELRGPLQNIIGHAELMLEKASEDFTREQLLGLQRIRRSAREVLDLIFSVLDLTRMETATLPTAPEEVSVAEVLAEIREDVGTGWGASCVDVVWRVEKDLVNLHTDRTKLKMLLRNLITNAIEATQAGRTTQDGRVTVDARAADGCMEVCVTDTGAAIAQDRQERIVDAFERLGHNGCGYQNAGLGLYIVKRFGDLLGGDLRMESAPGKGTQLTVSFGT